MDWVLEHIQLLVLVAGVVAAWLIKSREAKIKRQEGERRGEAEPPPIRARAAGDGMEVLDMRELIRRRLEERMPEMAVDAEIEDDGDIQVYEEAGGEVGMVPGLEANVVEVPVAVSKGNVAEVPAEVEKERCSFRELREGGGLKRAVVLREILGRPAGWR